MTKQQIIDWAREVGLDADWLADCENDLIALQCYTIMVAAHAKAEERERCAKVCAKVDGEHDWVYVAAIRALKD